MNNLRRPKSTELPAIRTDRPSRIVRVAALAIGLVSIVFSIVTITGVDALVIKNRNRNFYRRRIETNHQHQYQHQHQQHYTTPSLLAPTPAFYGRYSSLKLSSSSLSSKDSEFNSEFPPSTIALDSNSSTDSIAASATTNATIGNTTAAGFDSAGTTITGDGSKREERKRYDAELEEAFAQQTRERNPLLGVKSIGVDYGLVRTGIAVTIGYNPEGLDVIVTDNPILFDDEAVGMSEEEIEEENERRLEIQRFKVAERVVEWASRENVDRIVVGLPLYKNGTEAPQTALTRKFACDHLAIAALRVLGPGVSVYMCDERYTSKEAAARIRSSQTSPNSRGNNNDDLYGLLDAESAKIILEQHYADHLDRYSTRNLGNISDGGNNDSDGDTKNNVDPGYYNGELVTISDADLIEKLTLEYNEQRRLEREQLVEDRNDREARVKWRKLTMEQDRIRAKEQQEENAAKGIVASKKTKKKKKRKRK